MDEIEKLNQLIYMLGNSISDVNSCEDDLKYLEEDFVIRYPDYKNPDISLDSKKMLDKIKLDYLYFRRRNYVKNVFSSIEGILFAIKRRLLNQREKLSNDEIIKLQEYKFVGPFEDRLKREYLFLRTEENVKLIIRIYEKYIGKEVAINLKCSDWEGFIRSVHIRNKITHPKEINDLLISEDELKIVKQAHDWFFKVFNELEIFQI